MKTQAIVVESSAYTDLENFCDFVMRVLDARAQVSSIVGVERIGLRYVFEIRVPVGVEVSSGATGSRSRCSGPSASLLPVFC